MARVLYSATMSADGYIAGPGGDMSWLTPFFGPDPLLDELVGDVGAILTGARTYGGADPNAGDPEHEGAFGGAWHGPELVLTHHPPAEPVDGVTFMTDLQAAVVAAKEAAGERHVNILGADVARQCAGLGLLDEVLTCVVPVVLGDGTRLFHQPGGLDVTLERVRTWDTPHATNIWYRVVAPTAS